MKNHFLFFSLKVTIQWNFINKVIENKLENSLKQFFSIFHLKSNHFYLFFYITVYKYLAKYSHKNSYEYYIKYSRLYQSVNRNYYKHLYSYTNSIHTHEIAWVPVWVIWVLALSSRTRLMSNNNIIMLFIKTDL